MQQDKGKKQMHKKQKLGKKKKKKLGHLPYPKVLQRTLYSLYLVMHLKSASRTAVSFIFFIVFLFIYLFIFFFFLLLFIVITVFFKILDQKEP